MREPYERVNPIRDPEARNQWRAEQDDRCQCCLLHIVTPRWHAVLVQLADETMRTHEMPELMETADAV